MSDIAVGERSCAMHSRLKAAPTVTISERKCGKVINENGIQRKSFTFHGGWLRVILFVMGNIISML